MTAICLEVPVLLVYEDAERDGTNVGEMGLEPNAVLGLAAALRIGCQTSVSTEAVN
jgi:hypothetical protein